MKHSNKTYRRLAQVIPVLLLLTSCYSEMKVKVDVFDRNALLQSRAYKSLSQQKADLLINNNELFNDIRSLLKQKAKNILNEMVSKGKFIAPPAVIETVSQKVSDTIINSIKAGIATLKTDLKSDKTVDFYERLNNLYIGNPSALFNKFSEELKSGISDQGFATPEIATELNAIISKQAISTQQQYTRILTQYGESIINDPAASLIAQAPRRYWRKYHNRVNIVTDDPNAAKKSIQNARTNKVTVRTFLGNSDIAVKMESPGMFVVKGVRLDADAAVKASFKVLNQGIKYFAYANGIPVNSPAGSTENTGKIVHLPEKVQNDSLRLVIENYGTVDKLDKAAFFNILFSQVAKLDPNTAGLTDADVKQAIDLIQNAYNIYIKKPENQHHEISSE